MKGFYCGIDLGSTSVKAAIFDAEGKLRGAGSCEYTLETPGPELVELEPEIYWQSVRAAVDTALRSADIAPYEVRSAGLTGQAETLILLDDRILIFCQSELRL